MSFGVASRRAKQRMEVLRAGKGHIHIMAPRVVWGLHGSCVDSRGYTESIGVTGKLGILDYIDVNHVKP